MLYLLTREGAKKSAIKDFHAQVRAVNRYSLAAVILSKPVPNAIRRELRRASPGVRIEIEDVEDAIMHDVIKRDIMDTPEANKAVRRLERARGRKLRGRRSTSEK